MAEQVVYFTRFLRYSELDIRPVSYVITKGTKCELAKKIGKYFNACLHRNGNTTAYIEDAVIFDNGDSTGDMIVECYCPDENGALKAGTYGILRVRQTLNTEQDRYNISIVPVSGTNGFHIRKTEWKNRFGETKLLPAEEDGVVYMQSSLDRNIKYFKFTRGSNSVTQIDNPFDNPSPEYDQYGFRLAGSESAGHLLGMQKVKHK